LKRFGGLILDQLVRSHPAGVRGLKPRTMLKRLKRSLGRTPQGCVD